MLKRLGQAVDGRGSGFHNIFDKMPKGQVNIGKTHKGVYRAFHLHRKQTDYWFPIQGKAHVILISVDQEGEPYEDERSTAKHYFLDASENPSVLEIPPNTLHGLTPLTDDFKLLYWVTELYDPADELRVPWDKFGKELWNVRNE